MAAHIKPLSSIHCGKCLPSVRDILLLKFSEECNNTKSFLYHKISQLGSYHEHMVLSSELALWYVANLSVNVYFCETV